jgi:hypothetical protein
MLGGCNPVLHLVELQLLDGALHRIGVSPFADMRFQSQAGIPSPSVQRLEDCNRLGKLVAGHVERAPEAKLEKRRHPASLDVGRQLARQIDLRDPLDIRRDARVHGSPRVR